jgi:DNA-binding response OmpR family regulator
MLSASAAVDERIVGLSLGADDYLSKPFAFDELVARVRALYRRSSPPSPPILTNADIQLNPGKRTVHRGERKIALTRKEFGILEVLMMAEGATVSSKELLDRVWDGTANPDTNIVRVTMMHLRLKLGDPAVIRTAIGIGYQL